MRDVSADDPALSETDTTTGTDTDAVRTAVVDPGRADADADATTGRADADATAGRADADATTGRADDTPGPGPRHARAWMVTAGVAVAYLALSLVANWNVWTHGVAHSVLPSGGNDIPEEVWFLAQTPWVLLHGHNPLVNNWLNYPVGINLMDNTTMPLLGIAGFPITALWGPIATYNVMVDLAIFTSAMSFFLMARRFVSWWPAAFVGGLVYGFSPFTAATANAHLFLLFQAIPPLVILCLDRLLRDPDTSPRWGGVLLGLCFVAQFYVSSEAFATLVVMTAIGLALAGGYHLVKHRALPIQHRRLAVFGVSAVIVIVIGVGYGAFLAVAGPHHITGPAQPASAIAGISNDPVGFVVPTLDQHFTLGHASLGNSLVAVRDANWHIVFESPVENGSYIGVPLLLTLVIAAVVLRRRRMALFCAVMGAIALLMSMGSRLHVDGHRTGIPLPFIVIAHLPLLNSSVASRWVTYFWLFAGLLLALALNALRTAIAADRRVTTRGASLATGTLAVVVLLPLLPAWPYPAAATAVPAWFTSGATTLPAGSAALVYPIASSSDDQAMTGQAVAGMQFKMPGGFAVIPGPAGHNTFNGDPSPLQAALAECQAGAQTVQDFPVADVRAQLQAWSVDTVAVIADATGAPCAQDLFTRALGRPHRQGGVLVWTGLHQAPAGADAATWAPWHTTGSSASPRN